MPERRAAWASAVRRRSGSGDRGRHRVRGRTTRCRVELAPHVHLLVRQLSAVEAGRDDGHLHLVAEGVVDDRAEDDVRVRVGRLGDQRGRLVDLEQAQVGAAVDREQHAVRALHARLEQRAGDRDLGGLPGAVVAARRADAHEGADPAPDITDLTSAKSRLIRPGVVIRSVMPWTPDSSTWSALRKASMTLTLRSLICSSRSFGMTMSVSHSARSCSMPSSAWAARFLPSKLNGRVTTPMVSAPSLRATLATTGAPPVPVPPPSPAVTKTMSAPLSTSSISSRWSSAALRADVGLRAGAEPAGQLAADVELHVGVGHQQGLRVGVHRDELDALEADLDHPVHGVDAAAADADDLDDRQVVVRCCHGVAPVRSVRSTTLTL